MATHYETYYAGDRDTIPGRAAIYHDIIQYAQPFFLLIEEKPESPLYPDDTLLEFTGLGGQKIMQLHVVDKTSGTYSGCGAVAALRLYKSDGSELANVGFGAGSSSWLRLIGVCDNGVFVSFGNVSVYGNPSSASSDYTVEVLATVNNHGKTTIVAANPNSSSANRRTSMDRVYCVSEGDKPELTRTFTLDMTYDRILQLVPFESCGKTNELVYTPNAFYKKRGLGHFTFIEEFNIGDDAYISNGIWAIRDGGAQND